MNSHPDLSLLIPTYNEEEIIEYALDEIHRELGPFAAKTEILIVDDGKDGLPNIVEKIKTKYSFLKLSVDRNNPGLGKGKSIAKGFSNVKGEVVGFMDVDLSTPPRYIRTAFESVKSNKTDIFIGSRRVEGAVVAREQFFLKDILGHMLSVIARQIIFFGMRSYKDTQCGFKFFKNEITKPLYRDLLAPDGLNDLEVLIRANILNYRVMELGVEWTDLRESKRTLRRILWGEIKAMCRILWTYKIARTYQRQLKTNALHLQK